MDDRVREAYRHCEALVRAYDKDRYLASLFAPVDRRRHLLALYAFALEIGRVKAAVTQPMTGVIRLQWWLEAVTGLRAGEAAASPVMIALQDAALQTNLSLVPLAAAVEARQAELGGSPPTGARAVVLAMAARLLGAGDDGITAAAESGAQAMSFVASETHHAREAYIAFCDKIDKAPQQALPAFLPVALVPLRLKNPDAPQWRRQITLLRAAWFGFPRI